MGFGFFLKKRKVFWYNALRKYTTNAECKPSRDKVTVSWVTRKKEEILATYQELYLQNKFTISTTYVK